MADLRKLRESKVMTQNDLAEKSGVCWRTIWRLENGLSVPRFHTINKLARVLGVDPATIEFNPKETEVVPVSNEVAQPVTQKQQSYDEIIKQLNDKIEFLGRLLASEMKHSRFWAGSQELDIVALTTTIGMILNQFEKTVPGAKEKALQFSEQCRKAYRNQAWQGIPLPGDSDFNKRKQETREESKKLIEQLISFLPEANPGANK